MFKRKTRISIVLLAVSSVAYSQTQLPPCQGNAPARWDNCIGSWTNPGNDKYQGEWQGGKPHGQGIHTLANGERYVGTWRNGKYNGRGVLYAINGTIITQGTWLDNLLLEKTAAVSKTELSGSQLQAQVPTQRDVEKAQSGQDKTPSRFVIEGVLTKPDLNGDFTISIQANTDTSSLKINGEEIGGRADGKYIVKRVAPVGQDTKLTIVARDIFGNTDTKTLVVTRLLEAATELTSPLNVGKLRIQPPRDAVAIIVGIQDYKRIPKAEFANEDARSFYDYARRGLGIKSENIKLLVDADADDVEIVKAFTNWLPVKVNKERTEVYVFFSGHGLPSDDGKLYLLPYGVDKDLLSRTAVGQKELVAALQAAKPKSVTMFLDSCYSGQTRGGENLLAGARPVFLKVDENAYPQNFSVISASANSQMSSSSPDLKHGIFSYYLMKGMEGDADLDSDGQITFGEMQTYLADKVPRHAMRANRRQDPQMLGDADRVFMTR